MRLSRILFPAVPFACVLIADIISKLAANNSLQRGISQSFIPGFIQLTITRNTGIAFGIGKGHAHITTLIGLVIFAGILWWLISRERSAEPLSRLELAGAGCILGGALGNILDRVLHGEVTDFLEFMFISFPVFNVADVMIDVGAGLVVIGTLLASRKRTVDPDRVGNT